VEIRRSFHVTKLRRWQSSPRPVGPDGASLSRMRLQVGVSPGSPRGRQPSFAIGEQRMCDAGFPDRIRERSVAVLPRGRRGRLRNRCGIRVLTQAAKLIRTHRGKLVVTQLSRRILKGEQYGPLQALLFHVAFWRLNLAYFDGYPLDSWPQSEVGVILWSRFRHRHTIGCRGRHSRGFARLPDRRSGVAMGLWFQRHGGTNSPTIGLVRDLGNREPEGGRRPS
jgi:hypothetical protein